MSDNNNNIKLGTNIYHPVLNPEGIIFGEPIMMNNTDNFIEDYLNEINPSRNDTNKTKIINNNLQQVIEFQSTCGHTVKNTQDDYIPTIDERKLRLKLIFEELGELADAYGLNHFFSSLTKMHSEELYDGSENTHEFNKIEALDATCDLEVVVLGAYCINGFTNIATNAFKETMDSNMSKFCKTEDEALSTIAGKDDWNYKVVNGNYVFVRKSDNKILKADGFRKPNYDRFFE